MCLLLFFLNPFGVPPFVRRFIGLFACLHLSTHRFLIIYDLFHCALLTYFKTYFLPVSCLIFTDMETFFCLSSRKKIFRIQSNSNVNLLLSFISLFFSSYSYIELQFDFAMDLHPFYPPTVKIIRPRFKGFMIGRIASLRSAGIAPFV